MIDRERVLKVLEGYDDGRISVGVVGSHSALDVCDGAAEEGLHTIAVCERGRDAPYSRYFRARRGPSGALLRGVVVNAVNLPSMDAETHREQAPWTGLAEKMGRFLAQMAEGRMQEARLVCSGEITGRPTAPLGLAFVRGLLDTILSERVTDVNAMLIAKARGLRVTETSTTEAPDYASLLAAELRTDRGTSSVAGTVFFKREARFVQIDGFSLEALPQGWMLVFANLDVPGVIGRIGTLCGRHGINIAGMQLGRERRGGRAVSILNLDDPMPPAVLDEIRAMPDIVLAKLVKL